MIMKANILKLMMAAVLVGFIACPSIAEVHAVPDGPDVVFSAGRKDSAYWGLATRLKKIVGEQGLTVDILESVGSLQNLERLEDPKNPVNLTLAQSDAVHERFQTNPSLESSLTVMESIGLECVFLITRADSGIVNDASLPKGMRIAIPGLESGVSVTYRDLSKLNRSLGGTVPVYMDATTAMKALGTADQGKDRIDGLMFVHRPKERNPEIQLAIDNPERYRFVSFAKMEITAKLPDGQPIYRFVDIPLVRQGMKVVRSLPTVCTDGLLVASSSKINPKQKQLLDRVVNEQWMRIYSKGFQSDQ
jgi:TRAP-type uncharacterized transport system substrate-binding protein